MSYYAVALTPYDLMHYGIKGQHWYVRRYQNSDGSLTAAGKRRYSGSTGLIKSLKKAGLKTAASLTEDAQRAYASRTLNRQARRADKMVARVQKANEKNSTKTNRQANEIAKVNKQRANTYRKIANTKPSKEQIRNAVDRNIDAQLELKKHMNRGSRIGGLIGGVPGAVVGATVASTQHKAERDAYKEANKEYRNLYKAGKVTRRQKKNMK